MAVPSTARETAAPSVPNIGALASITQRLEAVLDHETTALRHNQPCDLGEIAQRKRQGLLELSRIVPHLSGGGETDAARQHLDRLAQKLERNRLALDIQLRAVREVTEIIAHTMRDAESDGTYSKSSVEP